MTVAIVNVYLHFVRGGLRLPAAWALGGLRRAILGHETEGTKKMKKLHTSIGIILGGLCVLTLGAQDKTTKRESPRIVVGTFDSRAVLFAYVRSAAFNSYLVEQKADVGRVIERARAAGDAALVADLEALGPAMQTRTHQQGFGTAPIRDILARIEDQLPEIARQAGVDLIVSKWNLTYSSPSAKFVDVSERMAAQFDPDEETLNNIREIMAQEPVPLDQLDEHADH